MINLIKSPFYHEEEAREALAEFVRTTPWFSMGAECAKYEEAFAAWQKRKYAVFVSSGSSANLVLIQALLNLGRLKRGDRVGISALTWATNVMPLLQLGLVPVSLDCNPRTLNVSPEALEAEIGSLKAVFLTNVLGFSDNIAGIRDLCAEKKVILLEDNCEALGSAAHGTLLGNFGLASTFSFFLGHHLSTIEGGMICTDDAELHEMLIMVRAHGWDRNLHHERRRHWRNKHEVDDFYAKYTFYHPAYNARPTEINGFLGNLQLQYIDETIVRREKNFKKWNEIVASNPDLIPIEAPHMNVISNFAMPVLAKDRRVRDEYKKRFEEANVEVRPLIAGNITKQPFYRNSGAPIKDHPDTDFVDRHGFYFGNNPDLTDEEVELLAGLLKPLNEVV